MKITSPCLIDTFKDEYHLNEQQEESLDEARDMMKYKPVKQPATSNTTLSKELSQRETDRILFESYYHKWLYNTFVHSSINVILGDSNYKAIVNMGKRAVPFIYEKIKEEPSFIVCALSEIYGYSLAKELGYKDYLGPTRLCELWIKKLEEDRDV